MSIPTRLTRDFKPGLSKPEFKHRFPYLDPDETLEGFFNHHLSRGDSSADWHERFLGFADWRNRQVRAQRAESKGTDSAGLPLDPQQRAKVGTTTEGDYGIRFMATLEKHLKAGLGFDEAHDAAVAELEGEST